MTIQFAAPTPIRASHFSALDEQDAASPGAAPSLHKSQMVPKQGGLTMPAN